MSKKEKKTAPKPPTRDELLDENEKLCEQILRLSRRVNELEQEAEKARVQAKELQLELERPENIHLALSRNVAATYRDSWKSAEKRAERLEKAVSEAQQARERVQLTVSYQASLLQQIADALGHEDWHTLPERAREMVLKGEWAA
jgi:hypothetical protein